RAEGVPARTVFHCFTGGAEEARRALELGCVLSFSGIVTFPSAEELRDAARLCPIDRLLVETDSPYLAPIPNRGKQNRPASFPRCSPGAAVAGRRSRLAPAGSSPPPARLTRWRRRRRPSARRPPRPHPRRRRSSIASWPRRRHGRRRRCAWPRIARRPPRRR